MSLSKHGKKWMTAIMTWMLFTSIVTAESRLTYCEDNYLKMMSNANICGGLCNCASGILLDLPQFLRLKPGKIQNHE